MSESSKLSRFIDFNDLDGSESKLRELIEDADESRRLEINTQLARILGLRKKREAAWTLLQSVRAKLGVPPSMVHVRVDLEEGRRHRDEGREVEAKASFHRALDLAKTLQDEYLMMDAAHMLAIVGDKAHQIEHAEVALDLAKAVKDPEARRWVGPLLNNLGWTYFELGQFNRALELFEQGVEFRKDGPARPYLIARYSVDCALRSLGRYEEALKDLLSLRSANLELGVEPPFVNEEIAECLLALGKAEEAKPYFARAFEGLSILEYLVEDEPARIERIMSLSI